MIRRVHVFAAMAAAVVLSAGEALPAARAEAPAVLNSVSADSHVVIIVPSWRELNNRFNRLDAQTQLVKKLIDIKGWKVPPTSDLAVILGMGMGLSLDQLDTAGDAAVVITLAAQEGAKPTGVMLLPVTDYAAFGKKNNLSDDGKTIKRGNDRVFFVRQVGRYAAIADTEADLKQVGEVVAPLAKALSAEEVGLLRDTQVVLRLNGPRVFDVLRPQIDKLVRGGGGGDAAVRTVADMLNLWGRDVESLDVGLALADEGVELRALLTAKAGSTAAAAFASIKPSQAAALVQAVPVENYLLALGATRFVSAATPAADSPDMLKRLTDAVSRTLGEKLGSVEQVADIARSASELMRLTDRVSQTIIPTMGKDGPTTPVAIVKVAQVTDGPKALAAARDYVKAVAALANARTRPQVPPDQKAPPDLIGLSQAEQEVAGGKLAVDVMTIDGKRLTALKADIAPYIILGLGEGENVVVRMTLVGNCLVSVTGGGPGALEQAVKAVRDKASLADNAEVAKVAAHVAPGTAAVLYVAIDRIANVVLNALAAQNNAALPAFPTVGQPVTLSLGVGPRSLEVRAFVPLRLVAAFKAWWQRVQAAREEP
ncbi:MAG: hypothetical protein BIFFINMI_02327 [Phycisphaerae bacterium]|nr:hypothetical protein [Phycisphaerae bacterium]